MKYRLVIPLFGVALAAFSALVMAQEQNDGPVIGKYLSESKPGKEPMLPDAKGAPNVIWILLDDVGYGAASTFGGGARTPVLDSLA
jgi:arylsulfatase